MKILIKTRVGNVEQILSRALLHKMKNANNMATN